MAFQENTSATYDESLHLKLGLEVYKEGSFAGFIRPMTPPLPILVAYWPCALATDGARISAGQAPALLSLARKAHLLLVAIPLVWLVYGWLVRRRGILAGVLGGALLVFAPNFLAHASIAATDTSFALFGLVGIALLDFYQHRPSRGRFLLLALGLGTALAAKQSAVFLFPVLLLVLALRQRSETGPALGQLARGLGGVTGRVAVAGCIALLVAWAWYGFAAAPLLPPAGSPLLLARAGAAEPPLRRLLETVPTPAPVNTLFGQISHSLNGHPSFLLGMRSHHGWWYYFPVAIALKSSPVVLILLVLALVLACRRTTWRDPTTRLWALCGLVFFGFCLLSHLDLGIRYLSILLPLLVLFTVDGLARWTASRPAWFGGIAVLLVAGQAVSALTIAPHYLSYFNPLAGGPARGYRYLVDSNLDWGQDLPALRRKLRELHCRRPLLAYFGTAGPEDYGLHPVAWDSPDAGAVSHCDYFALSASNLQGVGLDHDPFARFRALKPTARAAYTFFIYDLRRPDVRAALAHARRGISPLVASR